MESIVVSACGWMGNARVEAAATLSAYSRVAVKSEDYYATRETL